MTLQLVRPTKSPWANPSTYWTGLTAATAEYDPPLGVISQSALAHNAFNMLDRAGGKPIRVASKSVRVRGVMDAVLALKGFAGVLAYSLQEALWLADTIDDVVIGYPTADRKALQVLATSPEKASRITLMIDSINHLDFIDSVVGPGKREQIRVAIELDVSFAAPVLGRLGVWRSPVRTPLEAAALAHEVARRDGFKLVGMMAYEAQIAGVADRPKNVFRALTVSRMQKSSNSELSARRQSAVAAVRNIAELEFVNGGGTGSLETTSADDSVTELGAGSGLFGGHIFDHYSRFKPAPAAAFALSVVRNPTPRHAALLGGGWVASGPPAADRLPLVAWPQGLTMAPREQAGEVQTPLEGDHASDLHIGDRVWLRHAKSGELSEHLNDFLVVEDGKVAATVPTYRGEGKAFL